MVANTTYKTYMMLWLPCKLSLLSNNNILPVNAVIIPSILLADVLELKNKAPVIITKMGVRELRVPANALSMDSSAIQNRKAGIKLPNIPDKNTSQHFCQGIFLTALTATGNNTIPAEKILIAAI